MLRCTDLLCGAAGFSEGFRQAGFGVTVAVDNWAQATTTHRRYPDTEVIAEDIRELDPRASDRWMSLADHGRHG